MFLIHFNIICKTEPLRSGGCKIAWGGCGGGRLLYLKCFLGTGRDYSMGKSARCLIKIGPYMQACIVRPRFCAGLSYISGSCF